jgi:hypothetical protein
MTESGTQPDGSATIPQPRVGAGSSDLATESQDPLVLRDLLARARERLSFYESFDRIIGENIKRSGELMLETIQLREQADANAREAARARAEFDSRLNAERARHKALLGELSGELELLHGQLDTFRAKLQSTIAAIDGTITEAVEEPPPATAESPQDLPEAEAETIATESGGVPIAPKPTPAAAGGEMTRTIDALFHGIPDPGTAIRLQRHISEVADVSNVEAREFAEGILRLQVTASRALQASDFASWNGPQPLRIIREQPNVIEASLAEV